MAGPVNKSLRGIRDSIPGGYVVGRTGNGKGPPILLPTSQFASKTYVANTTIQVGGAAGGDLSGTYPNPVVVGLRGTPIQNTAPSDGQVLKYVSAGTDYEPTTLGANPTATAGDTAVNGTSQSLMRADAAPAVRIATTGQTGLVKPDGTTITIDGTGKISSSGGASAVPPGLDQIIDREVLDLIHGGQGSSSGGGGGSANLYSNIAMTGNSIDTTAHAAKCNVFVPNQAITVLGIDAGITLPSAGTTYIGALVSGTLSGTTFTIGALLATSSTATEAASSGPATPILTFSSPVTLVAGTMYAVMIIRTDSTTTAPVQIYDGPSHGQYAAIPSKLFTFSGSFFDYCVSGVLNANSAPSSGSVSCSDGVSYGIGIYFHF